jgi:malonate-semialdehyde dehydrogenase (acetylating)/methylmalonate-semialdehyde dehydrogenase
MPDAQPQQVINNLIGASCGAAGQRCMAISVAVLVGSAKDIIPGLAESFKELRPGIWNDAGAAYGPVISGKSESPYS